MPSSKKVNPRRLAAWLFTAALLLLSRPRPTLFWVGFAISLGGALLRIWACGHLQKNKRLACTGPYAHLKHPLYLGTLLGFTGLLVAVADLHPPGLWLALVGAPLFYLSYFCHYLPRKNRTEKDRMARRFGDLFGRWDREVPDLVPRLRPWRGGPPAPFSWKRVVGNSELAMFLVFLAGWGLLFCRLQGLILK